MQSFAEIQKAESEEMQRLNKIRAQEIEKQKANQINNKSQVSLWFFPIGRELKFNILDWLGWPSSWSTTSITRIQCCPSLSRCEFKENCSVRRCPGCQKTICCCQTRTKASTKGEFLEKNASFEIVSRFFFENIF